MVEKGSSERVFLTRVGHRVISLLRVLENAPGGVLLCIMHPRR